MSRMNWRAWAPLGGFVAGLVAVRLAAPLLLYVAVWWAARQWFWVAGSFDPAQLLEVAMGSETAPTHPAWLIVAALLTCAGLALAALGHQALKRAEPGALVTSGAYARLRHPQYVGCMVAMLGLLIGWPTWATLALLPLCCALYVWWALAEDRALAQAHGSAWLGYARQTPGFMPIGRRGGADRRG